MSDMVRFIVLSGWALLILVCVVTISASLYVGLTGGNVSEDVSKLAFTAAGFLFGSFPSLLTQLLSKPVQ